MTNLGCNGLTFHDASGAIVCRERLAIRLHVAIFFRANLKCPVKQFSIFDRTSKQPSRVPLARSYVAVWAHGNVGDAPSAISQTPNISDAEKEALLAKAVEAAEKALSIAPIPTCGAASGAVSKASRRAEPVRFAASVLRRYDGGATPNRPVAARKALVARVILSYTDTYFVSSRFAVFPNTFDKNCPGEGIL